MSDYLPLSQRTSPFDAYDKRHTGLSFPLIKKPRGYFQTSYSRAIIRSSIFTILSTRKGERVFLPEFGSSLMSMIFEPNDSLTHRLIKRLVTTDVTRWEPRVGVVDVRLSNDENSVSLFIEYSIVNTSESDYITIVYSPKTYTAKLVQD